MKRAAARRLVEVEMWRAVARAQEERRTQAAAVSPWVGQMPSDRTQAIDPAGAARQMRRLAREMSAVARVLRDDARRLEAR